MDVEKTSEFDQDRLESVVLAVWHILSNADSQEEEIEHVLRFFLQATGGSQSLRAFLFDEFGKDGLIRVLKSPAAKQLVQNWRPNVSAAGTIHPHEYAKFMRHVSDVIHAAHEEILADRNFAATSIAGPDYPVRSSVSRRAGTHSGWSMHFTASGGGEYDCIRQRYTSRPGDILLLGPDAVYKYSAAEAPGDWIYHWIYFQPSSSLLEWINWPELGPNIFHISPDESQHELFEALFLETQKLNSITDDVEKALFLNLVEQILIRSQKFVESEHLAFRDNRVNEVKSFISTHIREPVSISELAQRVGLSKSQLSILFKRVTGQTILAWANDRRMALAAQLLLQTDHSISTVADEVGFSDALYFSRKFRASTGLSPRKYRKNMAIRSNALSSS